MKEFYIITDKKKTLVKADFVKVEMYHLLLGVYATKENLEGKIVAVVSGDAIVIEKENHIEDSINFPNEILN